MMTPADVLWSVYLRLHDALDDIDVHLEDPTEPLVVQHRQETP